MKILVTGREGQLVRSLVARSASHPEVTLIPLGRPDLDMEKPDSLAQIVRDLAPDIIVNAAAYTEVDKAEDEPERADMINRAAPAALAAAARQAGARIIHISTDYVFDGTCETGYDEKAPTNPLGIYGRTKLAGEEEVRRANADHLIVRTAWIYSPFGRNFLTTMMMLARSRDELAVVDDQRGNPTSALDLADGLLTIVREWRSGRRTGLGQTYHLAGSGSASWFEFAQSIMQQCSRLGLPAVSVRPISTSEFPTRARRPANSLLDCAKFARDFSYEMPLWNASLPQVMEQIAEAAHGA